MHVGVDADIGRRATPFAPPFGGRAPSRYRRARAGLRTCQETRAPGTHTGEHIDTPGPQVRCVDVDSRSPGEVLRRSGFVFIRTFREVGRNQSGCHNRRRSGLSAARYRHECRGESRREGHPRELGHAPEGCRVSDLRRDVHAPRDGGASPPRDPGIPRCPKFSPSAERSTTHPRPPCPISNHRWSACTRSATSVSSRPCSPAGERPTRAPRAASSSGTTRSWRKKSSKIKSR